ncbi:MAG: carbohydrate kinase family protein [Promethearchaeota archaeon]|jgi:sugar/nucleoside kinase (ribokinase family)
MSPDIISLGELLVEIMRTELDSPHGKIGANYKGPYPSGAPAIFINSVARLSKPFNLKTGFIGVLGNDEFGECIIKKLKQDGVDLSNIKVSESEPTGIAFNQYNSDGSRKFLFTKGASGETSSEDINENYFKDVKSLHIMGSSLSISKKSRDACFKAINVAKQKNPDVIISFDPNLRPEMLDLNEILEICIPVLKETKIILPSAEEAEMLSGVKGFKKACQKLLEMGPEIIALKQGKKGCTIFTSDKPKGVHIKGFSVKEVDPTGAGDNFDGAFIVGYLKGWDLKKIGSFSNAAGALKVESYGPMPDTSYEEVMQFIERSCL